MKTTPGRLKPQQNETINIVKFNPVNFKALLIFYDLIKINVLLEYKIYKFVRKQNKNPKYKVSIKGRLKLSYNISTNKLKNTIKVIATL